MGVHDWTRVDAGIFHGFHMACLIQINSALNGGLLPDGYYSLPEQHAGDTIADVLTLHAGVPPTNPSREPANGGTAVAEAPPSVRARRTVDRRTRRRSLAIRHVSGHRLAALLEVVSPADKDRPKHVEAFVSKAVSALGAAVNLLVVNLFPPRAHDPRGMPGAICDGLDSGAPTLELDVDGDGFPTEAEPLAMASFVAGLQVDVYLEPMAVGAEIREMPLFLDASRYVTVPLGATYLSAYVSMPSYWREVLEGRRTHEPGTGV